VLLGGAGDGKAEVVSQQQVVADVQVERAMGRGIEAFRQGDLSEAERAFEAAYLLRPKDAQLLSWLAIVREQRVRQEAMTRALNEVQRKAKIPPTEQQPAREPLWKRLFLPTHIPSGVAGAVTPTSESRSEILTETKRAGFQKLYKEGIGFQPSRRACCMACAAAPAVWPSALRQIGCTNGAPLKASRLPYSSKIDFCRPACTPTAVQ